MACYISSNECMVAISLLNQLKIFNFQKKELVLEHENKATTKESAKTNEPISEGFIAHKFSRDYFAAITENKQLLVWKLTEKMPCCTAEIAKRPTCVDFLHNEKAVIVGDKSGDVYRYSLDDTNDTNLTLMLGHLSMVLDVTVSPDDRYVISADRDEKIRVSHSPNGYNILTFCLGHKRLVSSICVVDNLLLSASADYTLRQWSYTSGQQIGEVLAVEDGYLVNRMLHTQDKDVVVSAEQSKELKVIRLDENGGISVHQSISCPQNVVSLCLLGKDRVLVAVKSDQPFVLLCRDEKGFYNVGEESFDYMQSSFASLTGGSLLVPCTLTQLVKPLCGKRSNAPITPENTINVDQSVLAKIKRKEVINEV